MLQESRQDIIPADELARMFSNLPELMIFNEDLLRDFEDRIENWDEVKKISDVIVRKGSLIMIRHIFLYCVFRPLSPSLLDLH